MKVFRRTFVQMFWFRLSNLCFRLGIRKYSRIFSDKYSDCLRRDKRFISMMREFYSDLERL